MKKRNLQKLVKILLYFQIVFIPVIVFLIVINFLISPIKRNENYIFSIDKGLGVYDVGNKLHKENLIRNEFIYKVLVKLYGVDKYIAGDYSIPKNANTIDIINILKNKKNIKGYLVTFKEGKNIRNIARIVDENTNVSYNEFINKVNNISYIDKLINKYWFLNEDIKNPDIYYKLEGYLFPDTYIFEKNTDCEVIIETMLDQTNKILSKYKNDILNSNFSINELMTMSSIIENEGIYENDRKGISSVFYNRLKKSMPLGSDVTTYYAFKVDIGKRQLTKKEYNTYNKYNTRGPNMNGKLPVGPISNFSETSLNAAIYPIKSDYLYFVADKKGKTYFTRNYKEHNLLIQKLKKENNWLEG